MNHTLIGVDAQGRRTTKEFSDTTATIADGQTAMNALITDFIAVSDIGTSKYTTGTELAAVHAVGAAANKDEAVVMRLQMTDGTIENFRIPAPAKDGNGVFEYVSGGVVDIANANIVAFFDNFLAGGVFRVNGKTLSSIISGVLED
jgi:hypothetical protein